MNFSGDTNMTKRVDEQSDQDLDQLTQLQPDDEMMPGGAADAVASGGRSIPIDDNEEPDAPAANHADQAAQDVSEQARTSVEHDIDALKVENDELQQKVLRMSADYQNYVRRSEQNVGKARDEMVMTVARSVVGVLDHFDRALEIETNTATVDSLMQGMQLVRDELLKSLETFGVRRLEARQGDEFDPNRHEALMRTSVEGMDANCIAQQLQPGYLLGDKTIRPAQVAVTE